MPVYMKLDGVDGDVSASRGETTLGDIAIMKPLDGHPGGVNMLFGDGSVRGVSPFADSTVNPPPWGLDRIDQRASADPFSAYGENFLGGVDVPPESIGIHLEYIYTLPHAHEIGDLSLAGAEIDAKGQVMVAGFLF